jgi:hypothetical protein
MKESATVCRRLVVPTHCVVVYFGTHAVANLSELALDEHRVAKEEKRKANQSVRAATANIGS